MKKGADQREGELELFGLPSALGCSEIEEQPDPGRDEARERIETVVDAGITAREEGLRQDGAPVLAPRVDLPALRPASGDLARRRRCRCSGWASTW